MRPSTSKHRLFLGGLPNDLKQEALTETLKPQLVGLEAVDLVMNREQPDHNRGFAFLDFYNAECAKRARAVLAAPDFKVGGRGVTVDFAEPSAQRGAEGGAGARAVATRNVFVGNLAPGTSEQALREAFARFGEIERVHVPQRQRGQQGEGGDGTIYAFVTFADKSAATEAVEAGEPVEVAGKPAVVKYGRSDDGRGGRAGRGQGPGGYGMAPGGMVPLVPVQLANGQVRLSRRCCVWVYRVHGGHCWPPLAQ